jgi:microcystin-dependent protein
MSATSSPLPRRHFLGRALAALAGVWVGRSGQVAPAEAAPEGEPGPYVGEIRMFAGTFAPNGWLFCQGQLLQILENETLYNLIGTTYGGDGQDTFALPDLRGRAPIHMGQGPGLSSYVIGEYGGVEEVTLNVSQIPSHNHAAGASSANGDSSDPTGRVPARNAAGAPQYRTAADTNLSSGALLQAGGSQPHPNMQPFLAINYIISLYGVFPSP